jgi:hypothetical protein
MAPDRWNPEDIRDFDEAVFAKVIAAVVSFEKREKFFMPGANLDGRWCAASSLRLPWSNEPAAQQISDTLLAATGSTGATQHCSSWRLASATRTHPEREQNVRLSSGCACLGLTPRMKGAGAASASAATAVRYEEAHWKQI